MKEQKAYAAKQKAKNDAAERMKEQKAYAEQRAERASRKAESDAKKRAKSRSKVSKEYITELLYNSRKNVYPGRKKKRK